MSLKLIQNQNQFPAVHSWPVRLDAGCAQGPRLPLSPGGPGSPTWTVVSPFTSHFHHLPCTWSSSGPQAGQPR